MAKSRNLLSTQNNKTRKGEHRGFLTGILHLSPFTKGGKSICPNATPGCIFGCLDTAGRGKMNSVQRGRLRKTRLFHSCREQFVNQLDFDIRALERKAERMKLKPAIRLNGTSDIDWENIIDMSKYDVQFYDYTKRAKRMADYLGGKLPKNYSLTFSRSETNQAISESFLDVGGRVAVVFDVVPKKWLGYNVTDGDVDDLVFQREGLIGLRAKGKARQDQTGFVVR